MKLFRLTLLFLTFLLVLPFGCARKKVDLPEAPTGYSWYTAKNGAGSYLVPKGWFTKEDSDKVENTLYITREKITKKTGFSAGLTVKQITKATSKVGFQPSFYAQQYIAKLVAGSRTIRSGVVQGPTPMHVARVFGEKDGIRTIEHHTAIGLDDKDAVYMISFEAPASEWQALEPIAREINQFLLE